MTDSADFCAGVNLLPEWLRVPVRRVIADMQGPEPVPVRVWHEDGEDALELLWIEVVGDKSSRTVVSTGFDDPEEVVAHVAHLLQEYFFPESKAAWAQPRPPCPGHTHPAEAEVIEGLAWWTCPRDGRQLARVGELSSRGRWCSSP